MSAKEFTEWWVYHKKVSPIGDLRADIRSGSATAPLVNLLRSVLHKTPEFAKPSDWILDLLAKPEVQKPAEMKSMLKGLVASKGGKINKVKRKPR